MTKVFVVMSNDYPDCVFDEEWKADIYVQMQREWQKKDAGSRIGYSRIYYRSYEFEMNEPGSLNTRRGPSLMSDVNPTIKDQEKFRASLRARWAERSSTEGAGA